MLTSTQITNKSVAEQLTNDDSDGKNLSVSGFLPITIY